LNRLYNYSRTIDYKFGKEQNLFVAFPQKDGTITDGNLDIRGSGKCCHILKPKYFEKYDGRSYTDKDYLQSVMSNGTEINNSEK